MALKSYKEKTGDRAYGVSASCIRKKMYPAHVVCLLLSRLILRAALAINIIFKETIIPSSFMLKLFQGI